MQIETNAFGRIGLLGNPSDIYGGKGISFTFNRHVDLAIKPSEDFVIKCNGDTETNNFDYNGNHNLIKACINHLKLNENGRGFEVSYSSNIPIGHGFGGSSAIIIAALRAFNKFFDLGFDKYQIAELAMEIESKELNIACGPQDRYAISFEGMLFMDFAGKEFQAKNDPLAKVERLPKKELPFFLACSIQPKSSASVHNSLRSRFLNGETCIKDEMDKVGNLALEGKKALLDSDWKKLGSLMNKNFGFRCQLCNVNPLDREIVNAALESGALGAKLAGSGGGILVLADGNGTFNALSEKFACFKPKIIYPKE